MTGDFKIGRVSSVDANRHTAQVQFDEIDGFVSWDLQVLARRPGDYSLPEPDSLVLCVLLEGRLGAGFVIGVMYSEDDAAPLSDDGARSIAGDDIRLGDPDASDKVALAPKVKDELDKVRDELTKISTTISSYTGPGTFATPYTMTYFPSEPGAEKVSAK